MIWLGGEVCGAHDDPAQPDHVFLGTCYDLLLRPQDDDFRNAVITSLSHLEKKRLSQILGQRPPPTIVKRSIDRSTRNGRFGSVSHVLQALDHAVTAESSSSDPNLTEAVAYLQLALSPTSYHPPCPRPSLSPLRVILDFSAILSILAGLPSEELLHADNSDSLLRLLHVMVTHRDGIQSVSQPRWRDCGLR